MKGFFDEKKSLIKKKKGDGKAHFTSANLIKGRARCMTL